MKYIGRRLYYEKITGNVILDTGERSGFVRETMIEEDYSLYSPLQGRDPDTIGVVELQFGQYAEEFQLCEGFRVNPETGAVEFSFPSDPGGEQPVFQKPLAEQVAELKADKEALYQQLAQTNTDFAAFMDFYFSQNP